MLASVTPPMPKKLRFFVYVSWKLKSGKRLTWKYAVDVKQRRVDGEVINLVDHVIPGDPKRHYVGRFDPTQADTRQAILLGSTSEYRPDALEYRAAAWALQRLSWGADPATLPPNTSIRVELAEGTSDDVQQMLMVMRSSKPRGDA